MPIYDTELKRRVVSLVTKSDFGLGQVDNTSDAQKPVSVLQQAALDAKVSTATVGAVSGVAALDPGGKLPVSQLPTLSLASSSLADVHISTVSNNQVLTFNTATNTWINQTPSSGSLSGLAVAEIPVGPGDATTTPQNVMIRGPQGSGSNVLAADLIIRASGGTGSNGSGKIKFQTASKQISSLLYSWFTYADASTSLSYNVLFPPVGSTPYVSIVVLVISVPAATLSGLSISGGVGALTVLGTTAVTGCSFTIAYAQNVTIGGVASLTGTKSVSSVTFLQCAVFDSADPPQTVTTQTFTSGTSSSCVVPSTVLSGDIVFDLALPSSSNSSLTTTIPDSQEANLNGIYSGAWGSAAPWLFPSSSWIVSNGNTSTLMTRTYSVATAGTHHTFVVPTRKIVSSSAPVFTNAITLEQGTFRLNSIIPSARSETSSLLTNQIKILTPTSPRNQIITAVSASAITRVVILPRADFLPIGTVFNITLDSASTNSTLYVVPNSVRISSSIAASTVSGISGLRSQGMASGGTSVNQIICTLIDASSPRGTWMFVWPGTSVITTTTQIV